MLIDLHSHSTASDGSYSPSALVALAADSGISTLALTDHDTVAGIGEAEAEASRRGIRLIRGVEIEVSFSPGEFHLLGLDLGAIDGELGEALARLGQARTDRNARILERMNEAGIEASMEELAAVAREDRDSDGQIGRPHIAKLLVSKKAAKSRQDAFDRFLGKGRPFYEAKAVLDLEEGIALIRKAGGLAIVAHPRSLFVSWGRLATLMDDWGELGVDGIEAWHPTASVGECKRLEKMGRERGFRVTAGSDFHGAARPERKLGKTAGRIAIGDEWLRAIDR
ncbi:MAG TPA: PHP domain-containing protein [Rectinemataceae bacterium]|nr:PHP domain-containing protein [Rectinemataceae bacterium]